MSLPKYEIKLSIIRIDDRYSSIAKRTETAATLDSLAAAEDLFAAVKERIQTGSLAGKLAGTTPPLFTPGQMYQRGAA